MSTIASPTDLSGLTIWFDASFNLTLDGSGNLNTWSSRQGAGTSQASIEKLTSSDISTRNTHLISNSLITGNASGTATWPADGGFYVGYKLKTPVTITPNIKYNNDTTINKKVLQFDNAPIKYKNINTFFSKSSTTTYSYSATYLVKMNSTNNAYLWNPVTLNNSKIENGSQSLFKNNSQSLEIAVDSAGNTKDQLLNYFNNNWLIYTIIYDNIYDSSKKTTRRKRKYYVNGLNVSAKDITDTNVAPADFIVANNTSNISYIANISSTITPYNNYIAYSGTFYVQVGNNRIPQDGKYTTTTPGNYTNTVFDISGFSGSIAEIIFYNEYKTPDDLRKVNDYLLNKWGSSIISPLPTAPPAISQVIFFEDKTLQQNIDQTLEQLFLTNTIKIYPSEDAGATEITDIANITHNTTYNVRYQITSAVKGAINTNIKKVKSTVAGPYAFSSTGTTTALSHTASGGAATGLNYKWYFDASSTVVATSANPSLALNNSLLTKFIPTVEYTDTNYGTFSYDLTSATVVRLDKVIPTVQYLPAEGQSFTIATDASLNSTVVGATYQWFKDNTPIVGATGLSYTDNSCTATDSGDYKLQITYNGTTYDSNTARVDVISSLPDNIQKSFSETVSMSIQPISGATYVWVNSSKIEDADVITANTDCSYSFTLPTSISSSSDLASYYKLYRVKVTKNGVSGYSNQCCVSYYTSITLSKGISEILSMPNPNNNSNLPKYKLLDTTPDGRLVFIDDLTPRNLFVTEPNYVNRTSIDKDIQLYQIPPPPINDGTYNSSSTRNPRLIKYYGQANSTATSNGFLFLDGTRAYSGDGKYMAIICVGKIGYSTGDRTSEGSTDAQFIQMYKLEGTTITTGQQLIIGFSGTDSNGKAAFYFNNTQHVVSSNGSCPMFIHMSKDGSCIGVVLGSYNNTTGYNKTVYLYKKNGGVDTWGTVNEPSTATYRCGNVTQTYSIVYSYDNIAIPFDIHGVWLNSDASVISVSNKKRDQTSGNRNSYIYRFNSGTNSYARDTTLENNITTELQKLVKQNSTSTDQPDQQAYLYDFSDDGNTIIGVSYVDSTFFYRTKRYIVFLSYNSSTKAVGLKYYYNVQSLGYDIQYTSDGNYMLTTYNQDPTGTDKYIYKIPSYYINKPNSTLGSNASSIATIDDESTSAGYFNNVYVSEKSGVKISSDYNAWLNNGKIVIFQRDVQNNQKLIIKNFQDNLQNVKPVLSDTSIKEQATQDERRTGNKIYIHDIMNKIFGDSYNIQKEGILLRVANINAIINNKSVPVGDWKMFVDACPYSNTPKTMTESTTTAPRYPNTQILSTSYSSSGTGKDKDRWYMFRNAFNNKNVSTNELSFIYLDLSSSVIFNNDIYPTTYITFEYKTWTGFGVEYSTLSSNRISGTNNFNSFLVDGSIVTINNITTTPFSNNTGTIKITINNILDAPDYIGKELTPRVGNDISGSSTSYSSGATNQKIYTYQINTYKNLITPPTFTINDIINAFRLTMKNDKLLPNPEPSYYDKTYYPGGVCIYNNATDNLFFQVSVDGGAKWNFLTGSGKYYFFHPSKCNYMFRFAKFSTTTKSIYVIPWNGVEFKDSLSTTLNKFVEFSNIPNINTLDKTVISPNSLVDITYIETSKYDLPPINKYMIGPNTTSGSNIEATVGTEIAPVLKTGGPFRVKTLDDNNNVIDYKVRDVDSSSNNLPYFTPANLFYGVLKGGVRNPNSKTLVLDSTNTSSCNVYSPYVSNNQRIMGICINQTTVDLSNTYGAWQYSVDSGTTWNRMYSTAANQKLRLWWHDLNDDKLRIRFNPVVVLDKTVTVDLSFQIYDGADFVPYNQTVNTSTDYGLFTSTAYSLNGSSFATSSAAAFSNLSTQGGYLRITAEHVNSAPALDKNYVLNSSIYRYNSGVDISFNTIPINKPLSASTVPTTSYSPTVKRQNIYTTATTKTDLSSNIITYTYDKKNKFLINITDIISSATLTNNDTADSLGVALYSADLSKSTVKVITNIRNSITLSSLSMNNAYHIPGYLLGSSYNIDDTTIRSAKGTTGYLLIWMNLADKNLMNGTTNSRLFLKKDTTTNTITDTLDYIINDITSTTAYTLNNNTSIDGRSNPKLVLNQINGNPVLRFDSASKNILRFSVQQNSGDTGFIYTKTTFVNGNNAVGDIRNMIIVERKSQSKAGRNPLFVDGTTYNKFFFGYIDDIITLSYETASNGTITLSYSDPSLSINNIVRIWNIRYEYISASIMYISLYLNGQLVKRQQVATLTPAVGFSEGYYLGFYSGGNVPTNNIFYDGDICDFMIYRGDATAAFVKNVNDYLAYKWLNSSILIESTSNETIDLSYNYYIWDRTNESALTNGYGPITSQGAQAPYSINSGTFTLKIQKANSRPVLSMNSSTTTNTAILPANSTATKLAFKLGELDMTKQQHEFSLTSIFDDIIKDRYTDDDLTSTPPDVKGLAITSIDKTLGRWSIVKSDGTTIDLSNTTVDLSNAYLIKRDTTGNKLRLELFYSTTNPSTNRFQTSTTKGLPGTSFFQAIGWDSTRSNFTEYQKVNLYDASANLLSDVENPFSIPNNGVFEFRVTTRPYIKNTSYSYDLYINTTDTSKLQFKPIDLSKNFIMSQTIGTARLDIMSIENLNNNNNISSTDTDKFITLETSTNGATWNDIVISANGALSPPINGNNLIRIKDKGQTAIADRIFSLKMGLYDSGTTLYSPDTATISITVKETNIAPTIQTVLNTTGDNIDTITSSTIKYKPTFNDTGYVINTESPPTFIFTDNTNVKKKVNQTFTFQKPILWTDLNVSSKYSTTGYAVKIIERLNGTFSYSDDANNYSDITTDQNTFFLLSAQNNIKYKPTEGKSGSAILHLYAWDGEQGTATKSADSQSGLFSTGYIILEFPVIPRNNAPKFTIDNKLYPGVIQQTDTNTELTGTSIKSIIANTIGFDYVELNAGNSKGLVITDISGAGLGTWEVYISGATTWTTAVRNIHLTADDAEQNRIRFSFNTNRPTYTSSYSEIPTVRVAAWDTTNSLANATIAAIDASGAATPYSAETVRIGASITHQNHAPTLAGGTSAFSIGAVNANATIDISYQTILTAIGAGVIADPDIGDTVGIKIVDISYSNTPSRGLSMGTWTYTDSVLNAYAPLLGAELIPSRNPVIRFKADKFVYGSTQLSFRATDGELTSINTRALSLKVNDINYAPSITNTTDISYNATFDISQTILVSSLLSAMTPSDRNPSDTTFGIILSADQGRFNSNTAIIEYRTSSSGQFNIIDKSQIGDNLTVIHIPNTGSIRYTSKLNQSIQNTLNIYLWDRSNNSTIINSGGYSYEVPTTRDEFSPYSSNSIRLVFNHQKVNFAPTIKNDSSTLETINTLSTSSYYNVSDLLKTINWTDPNNEGANNSNYARDKAGLVVIGVDMCGGIFEYTLDGGSNWTSFPSSGITTTSGIHFNDSTDSQIRYRSTRNTTDTSTFTVIGWDQTNTVSYGITASIPSIRGGNTPYSANTYIFSVSQTHVNTRPVMTASNQTTTPSVNYSPTNYTWYRFSDYIPITTTFSDVDYSLVRRNGISQVSDKTFGILITTVDTSGGIWLVSSEQRTFTDITNTTPSTAVIVSPNDYFALKTSKNIDVSFNLTYKAWDKTNPAPTITTPLFSKVDTTDATNTSYSVNSGTITIPVKHMNTPPVIEKTIQGYQGPTLAGDDEDNPNPSGVPITSIIDDLVARGVYVDDDNTRWGYTGEPKGLVILSSTLNTTRGIWSYSLSGGTSWVPIPLAGNPLHLTYSASNRIRYRPSNNKNGTAVLSVAAWDQANGVANGTAQLILSTQRKGELGQSYSVNETTITFSTQYLNHAPSFTGSTYTLPTVEFGNVNNGKDWDSILTTLGYTDKDSNDPRGLIVDTITIPPGLTGTFQVLNNAGTWSNLSTGLQFTRPAYASVRFVPSANINVDNLNASFAIRPYDGAAVGTTSATVVAPVQKALFSPSITASLSSNLVQIFRADNKLSVFGGVNQGVSLTKLLDDMGFTDQSSGDGRGIAIQSSNTKGVDGYFEVKLGNANWARLPTIYSNSYYLLAEKTGTIANRIRFFSSTPANSGYVNIVFYGWDQSDVNPGAGIASGLLKQYTSRPVSFSQGNGTYTINIQRIVGK